jgi:GT2 family glycosyltransferase
MPASPAPIASVVVVNYNGKEHLAECLAALVADEAITQSEILVVDNASTDDSAAIADEFAARDPRIRSLRSPINRGYAGGVNFALPHARGQYIAVLNPDVVAAPGWLTQLTQFLETHPHVGAVNPLILLYDGDEERINAAGQTLNITGLGFNRWLGQPRARAGRQPLRVSGIQGGAFVIRRSTLEAMGGWDESGFLYQEDIELSWLLQTMGYDLYCLPEAVVRHKYHLTMYPEKLFLLERNRLAMLVANLKKRTLILLSPLLALTEFMMWGYCLMRGPDFVRAKIACYFWVARRWARIQARKQKIQSIRRRTDLQLLSRFSWGYAWDQFVTLGRERGESKRKPAGGLPVEIRP